MSAAPEQRSWRAHARALEVGEEPPPITTPRERGPAEEVEGGLKGNSRPRRQEERHSGVPRQDSQQRDPWSGRP
eukprot:3914919-Pyramimonas_sp.AAC.1